MHFQKMLKKDVEKIALTIFTQNASVHYSVISNKTKETQPTQVWFS